MDVNPKIFFHTYPDYDINSLPIIFLSGFGGDHTAWHKTVSFFPAYPQKITLDNQGVGRTALNQYHLTTADMALDVITLMDNLKIEKALIVGHSMGGAIAQEVALYAPERVAGLVLAASFAKLDTIGSMSLSLRVRLYETNIDPELKIENSLPWLYSNDFLSNPDNIEFAKNRVLQNPFPQTLEGMKAQLAACLNHNTIDRLSKISCCSLIIGSKTDLLVAFHHSELLTSKLRHTELSMLTNTGHMFIIEQPEVIADKIMGFYNTLWK